MLLEASVRNGPKTSSALAGNMFQTEWREEKLSFKKGKTRRICLKRGRSLFFSEISTGFCMQKYSRGYLGLCLENSLNSGPTVRSSTNTTVHSPGAQCKASYGKGCCCIRTFPALPNFIPRDFLHF